MHRAAVLLVLLVGHVLDAFVVQRKATSSAVPAYVSGQVSHSVFHVKHRGTGEKPGGRAGGARGAAASAGNGATSAGRRESRNTTVLDSGNATVLEKIDESFVARPYLWVLILCFSVLLISFILLLTILYIQYRKDIHVYHVCGEECDWSFHIFLRYHFSHWFSWTPDASGKIVIFVFALFVATGAVLYCVAVGSAAPQAVYKIFVWLVSPDGGGMEKTMAGCAIGCVMSVGGLLIFAMVLTLMQDAFSNYLDNLKQGRWPVMETNHIAIIGWNAGNGLVLVEELCQAYEHAGGTDIAILAKQDKPEVETILRDLNFRGSRLIVRTGDPCDVACQKKVAVDTCATAIIMPEEDVEAEVRDACVMQALLSMRGQGWPLNGRIISVCTVRRNYETMQSYGGTSTNVVLIDTFVAKLVVQCSRGWGLGMAVIGMLGFCGDEFYIEPVPDHLVGKTFAEAAYYYPFAVPVGIWDGVPEHYGHMLSSPGRPASKPLFSKLGHTTSDTPHARQMSKTGKAKHRRTSTISHSSSGGLCPPRDRVLSAADDLIIIAQNQHHATAADRPYHVEIAAHVANVAKGVHVHIPRAGTSAHKLAVGKSSGSLQGDRSMQLRPGAERVVIIGWNERIGLTLLELDTSVPPGSLVTVMAPTSVEERVAALTLVQRRWDRQFKNIRIEHHIGTLSTRFHLEDLNPPLRESTRIFVVPDGTSQAHADAVVVTTVLQIREVIKSQGAEPTMPIIPEISSASTKDLLAEAEIFDYVSLQDLSAQVLASLALEPRLQAVLSAIASQGDNKIKIEVHGLEEYMTDPPDELAFADAASAVGLQGNVVIGWTASSDEASKERRAVVLNPPEKWLRRKWSFTDDKLMVLVREKDD